jgi:alanine racemase
MNRYGMSISELGKTCKFLQGCGQVRVEGIYSHIYDVAKAEEIRGRFASALTVYHRYFTGGIAHLSATAGALLGKDYAFDMVRIGLGLYGYLPNATKPIALCKAMKITATTVCVRAYRYGGAGYDKPQVPLKGERLYTCRYGYADGFLRRRKNGVVRADAQANNLCMDACVRMGKERKGRLVPVMIDADETAKVCGTIAYDTLCSITKRATRIYEN